MTKRFTQKFETPDLASLDQRFQDFVAASQETVQAAAIQDVNILNELSLKLAHEKALANWEFERATARIRVLCGTHKEITGICTWSRVTKTTETFDAKAFKAAHEDFYGAYVTDGGTTVVQKTAKRKAKD